MPPVLRTHLLLSQNEARNALRNLLYLSTPYTTWAGTTQYAQIQHMPKGHINMCVMDGCVQSS
jgi:hypothetical protein